MINNCSIETFSSQYKDDKYYKTFKELSKGSNGYLVESQEKAYSLDEIKKTVIKNGLLCSADALYFRRGRKRYTIFIIEFKTGFSKVINENNFDESLWECREYGEPKRCKEGMEHFKKLQRKEVSQLKKSIKMKAVESFVLLDKLVFPNLLQINKKCLLKYIAVVDGVKTTPLAVIDGVLGDLAQNDNDNTNAINDLKKSLKKYAVSDNDGNHIMYDELTVMLNEEFDEMFSKR